MDQSAIGVASSLSEPRKSSVDALRRNASSKDSTRKPVSDSVNKATKIASVQSSVNAKALVPVNLGNYQWNLPPHTWSLPVKPQSMESMTVDPNRITGNQANDKFRRGRIYWYSRVDTKYMDAATPNQGPGSADPRYGFQFLYNPESGFTTSVSVNLDITPTSQDKFAKVVGAFPSGEALTVSVLLDRTNDFFCLRSLETGAKDYKLSAARLLPYYQNSLENNFSSTFADKIKELTNLGTLADVEYLYKAINGPNWSNPATGKTTSDIGFLSPTLLRIDIGPVSYIGYVATLQVSHQMFTQAMVPIRTVVSMQFNLMANAGLASGGQNPSLP